MKKVLAGISTLALAIGGFASFAPAHAAGGMGEVTNIEWVETIRPGIDTEGMNLEGVLLNANFDEEFTPGIMASKIGALKFDMKFPDGVQAGDTYTLKASKYAVFSGVSEDLLAPDGSVMAKVSTAGPGNLIFTFTDYVNGKTNLTGSFTQSVGYRTDEEFNETTPTTLVWQGEEEGQKVEIPFSTDPVRHVPTLRHSWSAGKDLAQTVYNYTTASLGEPKAHKTEIVLDRAGTKFNCDSLGVGFANWEGNLITAQPSAHLVEGTPKAGEYVLHECSDRKVSFTARTSTPEQGIYFLGRTVPDGTSGWEKLGRTPFTFTYTFNDTEEHVRKPARPVSAGSGDGEINFVDPVVKKVVNDSQDGFVISVENPSTTGVVDAGNYVDITSIAGENVDLAISEPEMGTVEGTVWSLPMLAPGESATTVVEVPADLLEPGDAKIENSFCLDKSDLCATAELTPPEVDQEEESPEPTEPVEEPSEEPTQEPTEEPSEPIEEPSEPVTPEANPDTGKTKINTAITIDVLANDDPGDSELDEDSLNLLDNEGNVVKELTLDEGTLTVENGKIVFVPAKDFTGTVPTVRYSVDTLDGALIESTIDITVEGNPVKAEEPVIKPGLPAAGY